MAKLKKDKVSRVKAVINHEELWDKHGGPGKDRPFTFGPHFSCQFRRSPRRILFSFSRYKFAQKMIGTGKSMLELGCSDGTGMMFLSQETKQVVCGVDFDKEAIDWAKKNFANPQVSFHCDDFMGKKYGKFGGIIAFDTIAHIYEQNEDIFMRTVLDNLDDQGVLVVGTPNIEADRFVRPESKIFSVNKFSAERLVALLSKYFHHVFLFGQNDEIVHTGFPAMSHYLLCVGCGKK